MRVLADSRYEEVELQKKLIPTFVSVLDSNIECHMKNETRAQFSIQQNQAKYSPFWWWRPFTSAAHHRYRKKDIFLSFLIL